MKTWFQGIAMFLVFYVILKYKTMLGNTEDIKSFLYQVCCHKIDCEHFLSDLSYV